MKQKVEISKNENSLRDGENEPANMGRNLDVVNVEMEKNEKGKKKKLHQSEGSVSLEATKVLGDGQEVTLGRELLDENITHKLKSQSKERKKEKKRHKVAHEATSLDSMSEPHGDRSNMIEGNDSKEKGHGEAQRARNLSEKSTPKGKSKHVSFADDVEVEVFSSFDGMNNEEASQEEFQVRGKRFSLEEDDIVKEAVLNYVSSHNLGEGGLHMVLHCKEYPEIKDCWKEIGAAIPWRPRSSVYYRAHILFERDESRSWSKDECDFVCMFHEKYGPDWKTLANILGKQRIHVKDLWRRTNLPNRKKGKWSQEEYQTLFDLVNLDIRMKAFQEKKSKHGMLRDNIPWTAISQKLQTRTVETCCTKWYRQLTSAMVAEGKWFDADDYHLLKALYDLDACCMEDVDWDDLLEHRSGDICRQRWNQMIKHLGEHGNKTFAEQVEILTHRYCPELLEAREAYDSKPAVP